MMYRRYLHRRRPQRPFTFGPELLNQARSLNLSHTGHDGVVYGDLLALIIEALCQMIQQAKKHSCCSFHSGHLIGSVLHVNC